MKIGLKFLGPDGSALNRSKTYYLRILSPFQMSNRIVKFNTLELTTNRNIRRQHHINAVTMYYEYLIRQFNLTSEWDLILQLATLGQGTVKYLMTKSLFSGLCSVMI